jgi:hypothetical protein
MTDHGADASFGGTPEQARAAYSAYQAYYRKQTR